MGLLVKMVLAFCVGWGLLHMAQQYWLAAVTEQITANSGLNLLPPSPALPTIDPDALRRALNQPQITIDTRPYERLAIESMARDMMRRNDEALARARAATIPPYIPGLHH